MEVGISTACFYPEFLTEETIPIIAEIGIKNVEVFLESYSEYDKDYCKAMRDDLDRYGIEVNSVHAIGTQFEPQLFSVTERQRNDASKMLIKVLEAAKILKAKIYVFHGPAVKKDTTPNIDFDKIAKYVDYIADKSGEYGIKFSWENVYWCWFAYPEFATFIRQSVKSRNVYFTLDIKQAMKSKKDPFEYLKSMGDKLINVHLCDYDDRGNLYLPGRGTFDFAKLNRELKKLDYNGSIIMEVYRSNYKDIDDLKEGIEYLKSIFER